MPFNPKNEKVLQEIAQLTVEQAASVGLGEGKHTIRIVRQGTAKPRINLLTETRSKEGKPYFRSKNLDASLLDLVVLYRKGPNGEEIAPPFESALDAYVAARQADSAAREAEIASKASKTAKASTPESVARKALDAAALDHELGMIDDQTFAARKAEIAATLRAARDAS